jgi:ribosomal protein S18 acetylase RimI-like enzyme
MVELLPDAFCLAKDLIERRYQPRPEAISVIDGNTPGWVFVDSVENPSAALVWAKGLEGFHFCGDPHSDIFRHDIDGFVGGCLAKRLMEKGLDCFEVSGDPGWETIIPHLFPTREVRRDKQCVYLSGKGNWRVPPVNPVPNGFFLVSLQDVLRHPENPFLSPLGSSEGSDSTVQIPTGFENHELACGMIERNWGTESNFAKKAVGFCITTKTSIVSIACSSCEAGATHAIEIETDEAYRRRGLAEIVAQALLNAHANLGVLSHWDCMEDNHASARLAEKLGLVKAYEYDLFWFPIDG